jgi:UDP-N-acetylglucosamine transferase subunit ALG13
VIFVTVGSNPTFRFDRLIEAVGLLDPRELVVQHGPSPAPRGVREVHEWLTFEQVLDFMGQADAVISHAGTGSIICATNLGHVPVVMPRLKRLGETVDDHQVVLATRFEQTGRVAVVWDAESLPQHVAQSSRRGSPVEHGNGRLQDAVHAALREAGRVRDGTLRGGTSEGVTPPRGCSRGPHV